MTTFEGSYAITVDRDRPIGDVDGAASELATTRWLLLLAVSLASFPIVLGDTALSVALPAVARDFGLGAGAFAWLVSSYTLALAVVLLPAGRLADLLGARPVFLAGLALFTLSSFAGALAPTSELLFGARVFQGAGAALVFPASLAIITRAFPTSQSAVGVGVWTAVLAAAVTLGPFAGASLTEAFGWRAVFLANVPLAVATFALAARVVPRTAVSARSQSIDVAGMLTLSIGLVALLSALTSGNGLGLSVVAGAAFALFVAIERRSASPLLDLRLFRSRNFVGANTVNLLMTAVLGSVFFSMSLYLQIGLDYSLLAVGEALTPMTALMALVAPFAAASSDRWGARAPMAVGLLVVAAALVALARLDGRPPLAALATTLAIFGFGIGLATAPITAAALAGIPDDLAGASAATLNVFRTVGLTIGVAAMGAVLARAGTHGDTTQTFRDALPVGLLASAAVAVVAAAVAFVIIDDGRGEAAAGCRIARGKLAALCICRPCPAG